MPLAVLDVQLGIFQTILNNFSYHAVTMEQKLQNMLELEDLD